MNELTDLQKKYIIFFCLGILTFFLSGYLLRGIHPPQSIYLMLLVYWVLVGTGILVCKERSSVFVAKAFIISFMALLLISVGFFAWSAHSHMYAKYIDADRLDYTPEDFVVVTEEELNEYPALKKAIETQSYVKVSPREWRRTSDFLKKRDLM
jgi:ABC-type iron transport system FetAB permease component